MIVNIKTLEAYRNASISYVTTSIALVASSTFLIESHLLWTVDSGATDHVVKDYDVFEDFCRIQHETKWLCVGNNAHVEVKSIGTCKLCVRDGHVLLLHDVFFVPDI